MRPYTTHPEKFNWTNLKAELLCFLIYSLFLALAIGFCLLLTGCSVTKTILVETIRTETKVDTIYLNTFRFDSIYVSHEKSMELHRALETSETLKPDTLYLTETNIEYRYKVLRDTIERIKIEVVHDSIPYEVRIETVRSPQTSKYMRPLSFVTFNVVRN